MGSRVGPHLEASRLRRLRRCAVLAIESRAAQSDHDDIAKAAKSLLDEPDKD